MTWRRAVVVGASGGIGSALADALVAGGTEAIRLARSAAASADRIDLLNENSIAAAAARVGAGGSVDLVIVATGMLHGQGFGPERSWRELSAETLARAFAVNAVGPALVAKHFLPLLPRLGPATFAALSARVGSISDNQLGGWYGYRASKAALNMLLRTFALELARTRPDALCVGLHPGTVDTSLSKPFQRNVVPERLFEPRYAAEQMLAVLAALGPEDSGGCFAWDGKRIPA